MAEIKYSFDSNSSSAGNIQFIVVAFEGDEAISRPYEYTIELKVKLTSDTSKVLFDENFLEDMLDDTAVFTMAYKKGSDEEICPVHGMLAEFTEQRVTNDHVYYRAVLTPRLWALKLNRDSRVFSNMSTKEVIENILTDYGIDFDSSDIANTTFYREYRCQFNETDFDYISRLMENEGIFYYFEQDASTGVEKMILSNTVAGDVLPNADIHFDSSPPVTRVHDAIRGWVCRKQRQSDAVSLQNYDPMAAAANVYASYPAEAASDQLENYQYGENMLDNAAVSGQSPGDEAAYLAEIRYQELAVRQSQYFGESAICSLRPGYALTMKGHPNTLYNDEDFLLIEVHHRGEYLDHGQESVSGDIVGSTIRERMSQRQHRRHRQPYYHNSFTAILQTADTQYRPQRTTPAPRFAGTLTAFIYDEASDSQQGASSGNDYYAPLDQYGRYKVKLPFRASDSSNADNPMGDMPYATAYIRMARPYVGYCDLTRYATEEDGSQTTSTHSLTEGMSFPLMPGTEVLLSFINGDPDRPIITAAVPNPQKPSNLTSTNSDQAVFRTRGVYVEENYGGSFRLDQVKDWSRVDASFSFPTIENKANEGVHYETTGEDLTIGTGKNRVTVQLGDQYNYIEGNLYSWGADFVIGYGNDYEEVHESDDSEQYNNQYFDMTPLMRALGKSLKSFDFSTGQEVEADYSTWTDGEDGLTEKNWGDKCEYHFGRMFAWSGGTGPGGSLQTYNYGNGYTENLLELSSGTAETNQLDREHDDFAAHGIDPAVSTIEKTFGDTYSYQNGRTVDIHVGDSVSETWGNANESVEGNQSSTVSGDQKSTVYGNQDETVRGNTQSNHWGRADEQFMGGKSSLSLAGSVDINAGATTEIFGGIKSELSTAVSLEVVTGAKMEVDQAAEIKSAGTKIEAAAIKLQKAEAAIYKQAISIKDTMSAKISSATAKIDFSKLSIFG